MTDAELQRRLDLLTVLANEVHAEARRRYGKHAGLYYECGGRFHVMRDRCRGPFRGGIRSAGEGVMMEKMPYYDPAFLKCVREAAAQPDRHI